MRSVIDRRKAALFFLVLRCASVRIRSRRGPYCIPRSLRYSLNRRGPFGLFDSLSVLITDTHPNADDSTQRLRSSPATPPIRNNPDNAKLSGEPYRTNAISTYIRGSLYSASVKRLPPACRGFYRERFVIGVVWRPAKPRYFPHPCLCRLVTAIPAWKPAGKNTGRHPGRAAPARQGARPARHLPTLRNATLGAASAIPLWASMPPLHVIRSMPHPAPMTHRCN